MKQFAEILKNATDEEIEDALNNYEKQSGATKKQYEQAKQIFKEELEKQKTKL